MEDAASRLLTTRRSGPLPQPQQKREPAGGAVTGRMKRRVSFLDEQHAPHGRAHNSGGGEGDLEEEQRGQERGQHERDAEGTLDLDVRSPSVAVALGERKYAHSEPRRRVGREQQRQQGRETPAPQSRPTRFFRPHTGAERKGGGRPAPSGGASRRPGASDGGDGEAERIMRELLLGEDTSAAAARHHRHRGQKCTLSLALLRSANPTPVTANIHRHRMCTPLSNDGGMGSGRLTLAAVFKQHPGIVDGNKLKCVGRGLTTVSLGSIPQQCTCVTTAYLSNNKLRSLRGLQALPSLRCLSAAHNLVSRMEAVASIGECCPALEVLVLEGNPVCAAPYYRQSVIAALQHLKQLDGRDVTEYERANAAIATNREHAAISLLVTGACHVQMLENIFKMATIHDEMRCGNTFIRAPTTSSLMHGAATIDADVLLGLWDYEGDMGRSERGDLEEALRGEMQRETNRERYSSSRRAEVGIDAAFDAAFKTVQMRQQKATSALEAAIVAPRSHHHLAREMAADFHACVRRALDAGRGEKGPEQRHRERVARRQAQKRDHHNHELQSSTAVAGATTVASVSQELPHAAKNHRHIAVSGRGVHTEMSGSGETTRSGGVDDGPRAHDASHAASGDPDARRGVASWSLPTGSEDDEGEDNGILCEMGAGAAAQRERDIDLRQHHHQSGADGASGAGAPSPGASEQFVHILETQQTQVRLRKQLVEIEEQSRLSVEMAERELCALQEDMEQSLEMQVALETRALEAEAARDVALQRAADADHLEGQVAELLRRLTATEDSLAAETAARTALEEELERALGQNRDLRADVDSESERRTREHRVRTISERAIKRRVLHDFADAAADARAERIRYAAAEQFHRRAALEHAWGLFVSAIGRQRLVAAVRALRDRRSAAAAMGAWKAAHATASLHRRDLAEADAVRSRKLLLLTFRSFVALRDQSKGIAVSARILGARLCLRRWWRYHMNVTRPRRRMEVMAVQLRTQMLTWRAIQSWVFAVSAAAAHNDMMKASQRLRSAVLLGSAFGVWLDYKKRRAVARAQAETADTVFLGMRLRRWRQKYFREKSYRLRVDRHLNEKWLRRYHDTFAAWWVMARAVREERRLGSLCSTHHMHTLSRRCFNRWYKVIREQMAMAQMRYEMERSCQMDAFGRWLRFLDDAKHDARRMRKADAHFTILLAKSMRFVLLYWSDVAVSRRHFRKLQGTLLRRVQLCALRRAFRGWLAAHIAAVRERLDAAEERISALVASHCEMDSKVADSSVTNSSLAERLTELEGELVASRAVVAEGDTRALELQGRYEAARRSEEEVRSQVVDLERRLKASEEEVQRMTGQMSAGREEAMDAVSHMDLQQKQMASEIESLRLLLSEKQMLLATCESVLEDAALQLEATAATCDAETMGHIVEVASGLRHIIQEQEKHGSGPAMAMAPEGAPPSFGSPGDGVIGESVIQTSVPNGTGMASGRGSGAVVHGVHYDKSNEISSLHDRISMRLENMKRPHDAPPREMSV